MNCSYWFVVVVQNLLYMVIVYGDDDKFIFACFDVGFVIEESVGEVEYYQKSGTLEVVPATVDDSKGCGDMDIVPTEFQFIVADTPI